MSPGKAFVRRFMTSRLSDIGPDPSSPSLRFWPILRQLHHARQTFSGCTRTRRRHKQPSAQQPSAQQKFQTTLVTVGSSEDGIEAFVLSPCPHPRRACSNPAEAILPLPQRLSIHLRRAYGSRGMCVLRYHVHFIQRNGQAPVQVQQKSGVPKKVSSTSELPKV
jgi:hypothetical protein